MHLCPMQRLAVAWAWKRMGGCRSTRSGSFSGGLRDTRVKIPRTAFSTWIGTVGRFSNDN